MRYIGVTHYTVGAHADLARLLERETTRFRAVQLLPGDARRREAPAAAGSASAAWQCSSTARSRTARCLRGCAASLCRRGPRSLDATSWGQLALKFIAAQPAVTCIIPATGKLAHLKDNLAGGRGRLPDARQREAIAQAFG